jgi:hypothetical protein
MELPFYRRTTGAASRLLAGMLAPTLLLLSLALAGCSYFRGGAPSPASAAVEAVTLMPRKPR